MTSLIGDVENIRIWSCRGGPAIGTVSSLKAGIVMAHRTVQKPLFQEAFPPSVCYFVSYEPVLAL